MKNLGLAAQTLFAELTQRALDAELWLVCKQIGYWQERSASQKALASKNAETENTEVTVKLTAPVALPYNTDPQPATFFQSASRPSVLMNSACASCSA